MSPNMDSDIHQELSPEEDPYIENEPLESPENIEPIA